MSGIEKRKLRHIRVSLEENVETDIATGFEDIRLIHRALPEIDLDMVSTETTFFGKKLAAPLIISAITGGTEDAAKINEVLAEVAEEKQIGIGVGSQRLFPLLVLSGKRRHQHLLWVTSGALSSVLDGVCKRHRNASIW